MLRYLKKFYEERPMVTIIVGALLVRLVAALFARGYGMHDDHFCVIETAQNWLWGIDLPGTGTQSLRNIFYIGIIYELFRLFDAAGIHSPQTQMTLVRILHALIALPAVWYGMKTVTLLYNRKAGLFAGALLAFSWTLASLSVRNLVEIVCVPPLVAGVWFGLKPSGSPKTKAMNGLLSGMLLALVFIIRYQTAPIIAVFWIMLAVNGERLRSVFMALAGALFAGLILGLPEYILYGKPFITVLEYTRYNADKNNIAGYPSGPWYAYLGTLGWVLIPPASLAILFFFLREWKKASYLVWPTIAFVVFHSAYPNKQERFILPALPFLLMAAAGGWTLLQERLRSVSWKRSLAFLWRWYWVGNTILLLIGIVTYSKKTRVESMSFYYKKPDVKSCIVVGDGVPHMPRYYAGRPLVIYIWNQSDADSTVLSAIAPDKKPEYIIYLSDETRKAMMPKTGRYFLCQTLEKEISPSLIDFLLWKINPRHNKNQTAYIYKVSSCSSMAGAQ